MLQFRLAVLDFGASVAATFGECKCNQQGSGKVVDDFDLAIAATAITYGLKLATLDARHFNLIEGLVWED